MNKLTKWHHFINS